jgi:hypothetical protein
MKEKTSKERTLFGERKKSTQITAAFNRRYIRNIQKNWEIKHENHLLPDAKTAFHYIDSKLSQMDILHTPEDVREWWKMVQNEKYIESWIQEATALLSWVYWQRLEGYETLDVSFSRERVVEDIGCIQQFYNAADALILEYQNCFCFALPIDIMCVYGLYQEFHTLLPYFILVPNHTRYEYIPVWISVAHEVAHILIDHIEKSYAKHRRESKDIWYNMPEFFKTAEKELRNGSVPDITLETLKNLEALLDQICTACEENDAERTQFQQSKHEFAHVLSSLESLEASQKTNFISFYRQLYKDLSGVEFFTIEKLPDMISSLNINGKKQFQKNLKEFSQVISHIMDILSYLISMEFKQIRKQIKRQAINIAETIMRVMEGTSGGQYASGNVARREPKIVSTYEHLLADIIATFIAGEFYLYSLVFYKFLPSVYVTEKKSMVSSQHQIPMSLRVFVCLETLKYSKWKTMHEIINEIERFWHEISVNHKKIEEIEEKVQKLKEGIPNKSSKMTVELIWNLIKSIMEEDFRLEKEYFKLLQEAENSDREENSIRHRFSKSHFCYMKHALGEMLRQILRNDKGFLIGIDSGDASVEEEYLSGLPQLIKTVREKIIDPEKLFTTETRYQIMEEIRKKLINGNLVLGLEGSEDEKYTPRNIISAYAQIYFEGIFFQDKRKSSEHIKAFNAAVMSMAWTNYALERFYSGAPKEEM